MSSKVLPCPNKADQAGGSAQARVSPNIGASSTVYISLPLPSTTSIRLLDVRELRQTDDGKTSICGTLRTVDLNDRPKYTALSYVWGRFSKPPNSIVVDDCRLEVTRNGLSALRRLFDSLGPYSIWIDAICIDQDNPAEKDTQLPLMERIYSQASLTYMWLGDEKSCSDAARFLMGWRSDNAWLLAAQLIRTRPCGWLFHRYLPSHLQSLLVDEWTTRLWTLQELLLSPNPVIVCGSTMVSWAQWTDGIRFLQWLLEGNIRLKVTADSSHWYHLMYFKSTFGAQAQLHGREAAPESSIEESKVSTFGVRHTRTYSTALRILLCVRVCSYILIAGGLLAAANVIYDRSGAFSGNRSAKNTFLVLLFCFFIIIVGIISLLSLAKALKSLMLARTDKPRERSRLPLRLALIRHVLERKCSYAEDRYHGIAAALRISYRDSQRTVDITLLPQASSLVDLYQALFLDFLRWTDCLDMLLIRCSQAFPHAPSWFWTGDLPI